MTTVREYVDKQSQEVLAAVIGRHGSGDIATSLSDHLVATLHALDTVLQADDDTPDPRAGVVAEAERALAHYLTESFALRIEPDADEDVLGGYEGESVEVYANLETTRDAVRPECPDCGTRVDEDGYCTDAGCPRVGKTVGV